MSLKSPEEVAGIIVAAIKRKGITFHNHQAEVDVVLIIRNAIETDRHDHCQHVAMNATSLLSENQNTRSTEHGQEQ